ncbi:MAG: alpha/beta hydrolase [Coprobacillus sp.]|nr:alpha/beta hydrolase [Coprobacillus sp.]
MKYSRWMVKLAFWWISQGEKLTKDKKKFLKNYETINEIEYDAIDPKKQRLSIYYPKKENDKHTLAFDVHGGCYTCNNLNANIPYLHDLVDRGYTVVNIDYRLIKPKDKVTIKEQIIDVFKAIDYINNNKDKYHLPKKNVLIGDSSGGHLALLFALLNKEDKSYLVDGLHVDIKLSSIVLSCPVFNYQSIYNWAKTLLKERAMDLVWPKWSDPEYIKLYSPETYLDETFDIPLIYTSSKKDFIGSQSQELDKRVNECHLEHEFVYYDTDDKKINHIYNQLVGDNHPIKKEANDRIEKFIDSHS